MIRHRYSSEEQNFRTFLRKRRREAGLRQADLAERLGVPQSFVSKYESGERLLTFIEAVLILKQLGATVNEAAKQSMNGI